jgi:hypothetical protein
VRRGGGDGDLLAGGTIRRKPPRPVGPYGDSDGTPHAYCHYWAWGTVLRVMDGGEPELGDTATDSERALKVPAGARIYVVTWHQGTLRVVAAFTARGAKADPERGFITAKEYRDMFGERPEWRYGIVAEPGTSSRMSTGRMISREHKERVRFVSGHSPEWVATAFNGLNGLHPATAAYFENLIGA